MSISSLEQALFRSVEEINRLIAELNDLRIRVRRAEANALAGRQVPQENRAALLTA